MYQDSSSLKFVENPVFNECFPNSTKMYKEIEHDGENLKVSEPSLCFLRDADFILFSSCLKRTFAALLISLTTARFLFAV